MEINNEEHIIHHLETIFDDRYVLQKDCNDTHNKLNKELSVAKKDIELIRHDFSIIKKLLWSLVSASISTLTVLIMEFIFK